MSERWFAWLLGKVSAHHDRLLAGRKQKLFAGLSGKVVEFGPGTGVNLQYYSPQIHWIGIEPNPFMHAALIAEASLRDFPMDVRAGVAENTGLADASVDAVVSTLVLCSVAAPAECLAEALRILKPGGKFLFIEHVGAPRGSRLLLAQRILKPLWGLVGGGCNPARHTIDALREAGFHDVRMEEFRLPMGIVAPHISGIAIR